MTGPDRTTTSGSFGATLRDFWEHRPIRPRHGRKLGGVSAALGYRYGIDPVLIRVAFIVGAFYGGAGVVLYLLGWLMLPQEGVPGPDGRPTGRPTSGFKAVVLVCLLVAAGMGAARGYGLFGLAVGLGVLYLLHRNYRDRTPGAVPASPGSASGGSAQATHQSTMDETVREQPPDWDPLGAAPFAWDLPEPGGEEPPAPPEPASRPVITQVTLALALLAAGLALASGFAVATALALGLGVLGAGMITGSFLHGGRGLIAAAIPVGVLALLLNVVSVGPWNGFVNYDEHPATVQALRPAYKTSAGDVRLDLRDLSIPARQEVRTSADVGAGAINVRLPRDAAVEVRCTTDLGSVDCLGEHRDGQHAHAEAREPGADPAGGGRLVLDLKAGTGNVEVSRD